MTQYLETLEMLVSNYKACYGNYAYSIRYNQHSLLFNLLHCAALFRRVGSRLKDRLIIDIDRDVDYRHWGNIATWTALKPQPATTDAPPTDDAPSVDKLIGFAIEDQRKLNGRRGALSDRELKQMQNDLRETCAKSHSMDDIIHAALQLFCNTLLAIADAIEAQHDSRLYEQLYYDQKDDYNRLHSAAADREYDKWKNRHLTDRVTEDSLCNFLESEMVRLFRSGALDGIVANATRQQMTAYRQEVNFGDHDVPEGMHPYSLYSRLRDIYDFSDGMYHANWVKAGRLLFLLRRDPARLEALLHFDRMVQLTAHGICHMRDCRLGIALAPDFDPAKVLCRFPDDMVKQSPITNHADVALALIDRMSDGVYKAWWVCFYCVLLKRGWIRNNVSSYCESMKALYGIDLDRRSFNTFLRQYGADVERWPNSDPRMKEKRDFGLRFQAQLDACVNYRLIAR